MFISLNSLSGHSLIKIFILSGHGQESENKHRNVESVCTVEIAAIASFYKIYRLSVLLD